MREIRCNFLISFYPILSHSIPTRSIACHRALHSEVMGQHAVPIPSSDLIPWCQLDELLAYCRVSRLRARALRRASAAQALARAQAKPLPRRASVAQAGPRGHPGTGAPRSPCPRAFGRPAPRRPALAHRPVSAGLGLGVGERRVGRTASLVSVRASASGIGIGVARRALVGVRRSQRESVSALGRPASVAAATMTATAMTNGDGI